MDRRLVRPVISMVVTAAATAAMLWSGDELLIVPGMFLVAAVVAAVFARRDRWAQSYAGNAAAGVVATVAVIAIGVSRIDQSDLDSARWVIGAFWMMAGAVWASLGVGVVGPLGWVLRTRVMRGGD